MNIIDITPEEFIFVFLALVLSALISFFLTPAVRVLAFKLKALDYPKDNRRMHTRPIPLLGGIAIFVSFVISAFVFGNITPQILGLMLGMALIVLLGLLDDIYNLKPYAKFIAQIIISLIPVFFGITIKYIHIFGITINFGFMSGPVTVLWIVLMTNAINLIDGLDGLACGISTISAVCLMITSIINSDPSIALLTAILAGACLGFLPFNINPAKIFMGDTGALMLGYTLSVLSIMGLFKFNAVVSFFVPFLIFALPFGDTTMAIIRRLKKGQSPFSADKKHLHHRLINLGFSQKQSVIILYATSALLGISAILFMSQRILVASLLVLIGFVIILINVFLLKSNNKIRKQTGIRLNQIKSENGGIPRVNKSANKPKN